MNLLTLDEARRAVVVSAGSLVFLAECSNSHRLEQLLWGGDGGLDDLSEDDRALAHAHYRVLKAVEDQGYGWAAAEELEGICSAVGLAEGRRDCEPVLAAAVPPWSDSSFAA